MSGLKGFYRGPIDGSIGQMTARATQEFLQNHNINPGPIDGNWGDQTSCAIQRFLQMRGYNPGPIDGQLRDGGRMSTTAFQTFLRDQGVDPGPIDGSWGSQTVAAWQRFLSQNKIEGQPTVRLIQTFSCSGGSSGHRTVRVKKGMKNHQEVTSNLKSEISASISGPIQAFTAGISASVSQDLSNSVSSDSFSEEEIEVHINLEQPCYIYQLLITVPTRFGIIEMTGNEVYSNVPLN